MSYTFEKTNSYTGVLHFELAAEAIEEEARKAYFADRAKYPIPGFRRGKAPRKVIEQYFGDVFTDKAVDELMNSSFKQALDEGAPNPVTQPAAKNLKMNDDGSATFDIEYQVLPDVELGDYMGLTVDVNEETLTDDAVENEIQRTITRNTRYVPVTDRPVKMDDRVRLDYAGTMDGVAFEGGSQENATLDIGSGHFIPGFEEGLVGMSVDEEKDLELTFPEQYKKDLAGKPVVFHVKIHEITEPEVPELNDEFVADISEFSTVDDYRTDVRKKLQDEIDKRNEEARMDAVTGAAIDNAKVEISPELLNSEVESLLQEYDMNMRRQGMSLDDYLKASGMNRQVFVDLQVKPTARMQLTSRLVLDAIIEKEQVECTDEMYEEQLEKAAKSYGMTADALKKALNGSNNENIRHDAKITAVVKKMVDSATFHVVTEEEKATEEAEEKAETEETTENNENGQE